MRQDLGVEILGESVLEGLEKGDFCQSGSSLKRDTSKTDDGNHIIDVMQRTQLWLRQAVRFALVIRGGKR